MFVIYIVLPSHKKNEFFALDHPWYDIAVNASLLVFILLTLLVLLQDFGFVSYVHVETCLSTGRLFRSY